MARKTHRKEQAQPRSTALVFADPERIENAKEEELKPMTKEEKAQLAKQIQLQREQETKQASFPLNYVYGFQDFANEHMTFCKFVEMLVVGYVAEIFYLYYFTKDWKLGPPIGFNILGIILGTIFAYRKGLNKHEEDPDKFKSPRVPEFNLIYAVFIPLSISVLTDLRFSIINLSLNYFVVENLHPFAKVASSVMFFQIYNENEEFSVVYYLAIAMVHYMITYVIESINQGTEETETELSQEVIEQDDNINDKLVIDGTKSGVNVTLTKTEIHLLGVFLINLLLNECHALPFIIFQKMIISLTGSLVLVYPVFKLYETNHNKLLALAVIAIFAAGFYYGTNKLLFGYLKENAIVWLYEYIYQSEMRTKILTLWIALLSIAIPTVQLSGDKLSLNSRRKIWHYLLLVSITYPLLVETDFTLIALLGSLIIFIVVEIVRYNKFTIIGAWLYNELRFFQDFKDLKGPLNLSYIFLILGVTLPMVYDLAILQNDQITYRSFIGIISLGLGDSMASVIGKNYGTIKWKHGNKSIQGTITFIIVSMIGFYLINQILSSNQQIQNWENVFISCLLGGILEGVSTLNDNFLIPCIMVISLEIINLKFP